METCDKCASTKVIEASLEPGATGADVHATVVTNPQAILFRGAVRGNLTATVCGDCGHVSLRVSDATRFYEKARAAKE